MRIYFSGIGGVGIGPLAEIARDAGYDVLGSDLHESPLTAALQTSGVPVAIGQSGEEIAAAHSERPIDRLVYTAALPADHPELQFAQAHNIPTAKRDELLAEIIAAKDLKLIAVSGTHGKTTTTALLVWALQQLDIPVSYSVGTTLSFGPSGRYVKHSEYFVYECDEYDRNMLHFKPHLTVIPSLDHDHFDIYPTPGDYRQAFVQFLEQSHYALMWERDLRFLHAPDIRTELEAYDDLMDLSHFTLPGKHNRHNAFLVEQAIHHLLRSLDHDKLIAAINAFPGSGRRFEKLADNLYSDYGHHPVEIAATLQLAREVSNHVVVVYQPHQNSRQHEIAHEYENSMELAEKIYWLPTYLSREDPSLEVLTPKQLISRLHNKGRAEPADMDDDLWANITAHREAGQLVLVMGAGSVDEWVRAKLDI